MPPFGTTPSVGAGLSSYHCRGRMGIRRASAPPRYACHRMTAQARSHPSDLASLYFVRKADLRDRELGTFALTPRGQHCTRSMNRNALCPTLAVERAWLVVPVTGLAWSGRGTITRGDVSTDGGQTWMHAELVGPVLPIARTRFRLMWHWDGAPARLTPPAIDETGWSRLLREPAIGRRAEQQRPAQHDRFR